MLKWAVENGCLLREAKEGRPNILHWLKAHGAWPEATCAGAASGGHLELLKWLREQGCPWDWRVLDESNGAYSLVYEWAEENGCAWEESDSVKYTPDEDEDEDGL